MLGRRWIGGLCATLCLMGLAACQSDTPTGPGSDAAQGLAKQALPGGGSRTVAVSATVTREGEPLDNTVVRFARSVSGRPLTFDWQATTDAAGQAAVVLRPGDPTDWRRTAAGYYVVEAVNPLAASPLDAVVGRWGSVPIPAGGAVCLELEVGAPAVVLPDCGVQWDLNGDWVVTEVRWDGEAANVYPVSIVQEGAHVDVYRDGDLVTSATVSGDSLVVADWGGYGVSRLYVDGPHTMHSDVPLLEFLNRLDLRRGTFHETSFESGLGTWSTEGTDLMVGDEMIDWTVAPDDSLSQSGSQAVRLFMDNRTDAGKIWLQRAFDVAPSAAYEVRLNYWLASSDWGDINLFRIIAGASAETPLAVIEGGKQLPPEPGAEPPLSYFQGTTGNGQGPDAGHVWMEKAYTFTTTAGPDGRLYVAVGIWGTWESPRTYFIDDLTVTLVRE